MTKQVMQFRICDNHPDGREVAAVVTEKLSLNGAKVELDLCQDCSNELFSTYVRWADLGTPIGSGSVFDGQRKLTGPLMIDLSAPRPVASDRRIVVSEEDIVETAPVERRAVSRVPATAHRWVFIDHAIDRLNERKLDVDDVLLAAERPEKVLQSKANPDRLRHFRGNVVAVVDPYTFEIITAYDPRIQEEDFEFTPAKKAVGAH